jgi:acyl-CoA dehydrogenase
MDLGLRPDVKDLRDRIRKMVREEIMPVEHEYFDEVDKGRRFELTARQTDILESLKDTARSRNLWNFWLTEGDHASGLSTVDYAYLAEEMGWSHLAPEVFNCSAPDTGNMEVLAKFGTDEQKKRWLDPLLDGKIRSAYLMTEPGVASSDATNISLSAKLEGDEWVLNGEKWWASGAGDPRCAIYIVMALTDPDGDNRHTRHSQILVPADTPGVEVLRAMQVFGRDDAPHGHMHIRMTDVRVPKENVVAGPGRGFEISQARLGPGRIHHCMRAIGQSERAFALMCGRAASRVAFGKPLARLGQNPDIIAECRMSIEEARLVCLRAAWAMDHDDPKEARAWISHAKVTAPRVALKVIDEAIQMHGGMGVSQDTPLADMYTALRTLRLADGPDAVHRMVIARQEMRRFGSNQ